MSATDVAAWVGATSGLGAVLWDFYKWRTTGPKLHISVNPGMEQGRHPPLGSGRKYIGVWVENIGTTATTITCVSFATYDSWWNRKRLRRSKGGFVLEPLSEHPLPHKLGVGEQWQGAINQGEALEKLLETGNMWCDVYHAWSKRPAQVKVKTKE